MDSSQCRGAEQRLTIILLEVFPITLFHHRLINNDNDACFMVHKLFFRLLYYLLFILLQVSLENIFS